MTERFSSLVSEELRGPERLQFGILNSSRLSSGSNALYQSCPHVYAYTVHIQMSNPAEVLDKPL